MKRFKNILYVIESTTAVPKISEKVQSLARLNEARVHIAVLQEPMPSHNVGTQSFLRRMEELRLHFKKEHEEFLHNAMEDARWQGTNLTGSIISGIGFVEIIKHVLNEKHDLIMIEEPTLTRIKINQLAMKLVRKCPCPVWIIRSKPLLEIDNILAAVDLQENEESKRLNSKIIQLASSLAQREQGLCHFLHVYRLEFESELTSPKFNIPVDEISEIKRDIINHRKILLKDLFETAGVQANESQIILREGDPTEEIEQTIQDLSIDTLVMGSLSESGIPGFLTGNRAEKILSEIECSVLTVKPDDFISPITIH